MKYTIQKIPHGEEELILRYQNETPEITRILHFLDGEQTTLVGLKNKQQVLIRPQQILYIESVDGRTFAYTEEDVLQLEYTLSQAEYMLSSVNFFRCSKSTILNIDKIKLLKSLPSNRIDAMMCSGEHILISRTYASDFRKRLKGGQRDE